MSSAFVEGERTSAQETIENRLTKTTTNLAAFSLEQRFRPRRTLEIRYSYRYERNRTLIVSGTDPFDITVTAPRLQVAALIDRRNDPFNPERGWFASQSIEYSTPGLGSDLGFIKGFSQFQFYHLLGRHAVLASNVRFGAARAFDDQVLIPSERFVTGGGASVRGYDEDEFGTSPGGARTGGDGLFVFNQELRFPVYRWLSGVGFFDTGNVFGKVSAFELNELRSALGAGLRFDSPVGLLRVDLGVPWTGARALHAYGGTSPSDMRSEARQLDAAAT